MNQITKVERHQVIDPVPVLDTAQFEHMQRIATVMARSSLVPDALCMGKDEQKKVVPLPYEQVLSNCFLVVNQAVRWGLDPFAVAQCVSVVHGRPSYEGKLVAAVLEAKLGIRLHHHFVGKPGGDDYRIYLCDRPFDTVVTYDGHTGPLMELVQPGMSIPGLRIIDGSVGEWKTTGNNSPWAPKNHYRMLIYRGTRDWARIYESALMLGVYTQDEMVDLAENARALRARDISRPSLADRLAASQQGASVEATILRAAEAEHDQETGEIKESPEAAAAAAQGEGRAEGSGQPSGAAAEPEIQPAERSTAHVDAGKSPGDRNPGDAGSVTAGETAKAAPVSDGAATNQASAPAPSPASEQAAAAPPPAAAAASPKKGSLTQEEAYGQGRLARSNGQTKKSCPKIIRDDAELHDAWLTGYDESPDE